MELCALSLSLRNLTVLTFLSGYLVSKQLLNHVVQWFTKELTRKFKKTSIFRCFGISLFTGYEEDYDNETTTTTTTTITTTTTTTTTGSTTTTVAPLLDTPAVYFDSHVLGATFIPDIYDVNTCDAYCRPLDYCIGYTFDSLYNACWIVSDSSRCSDVILKRNCTHYRIRQCRMYPSHYNLNEN